MGILNINEKLKKLEKNLFLRNKSLNIIINI